MVPGAGTNLLGRDLLQAFEANVATPNNVNNVQTTEKLQDILDKHDDLFQGKLGKFNGPPVTLHIDEWVLPQVFQALHRRFSLKEKVEKELECLQSLGIIEAVKHSKWVAPIVAIT